MKEASRLCEKVPLAVTASSTCIATMKILPRVWAYSTLKAVEPGFILRFRIAQGPVVPFLP